MSIYEIDGKKRRALSLSATKDSKREIEAEKENEQLREMELQIKD